jgi:formylglycine-generating enzyme required for sulfatase activity/dienelactone hydrolase
MRKHVGVLVLTLTIACVAFTQNTAPRIVDLKAADATLLKGTYFPAGKPGPGVVLLHQINRDRKSWDPLATQLAAAGINTLTIDMRGFGESGTRLEKLTDAERSKYRRGWPDDIDVALEYLSSQPGVDHNLIGLGGAGWLGVLYSVEAARRHPAQIKSLVLMSGETLRDGLQFLHQASQLPELFVFSDDDEYPPTQDAMKLLYVTASSPSKKLVHYSAVQDAPWLWYETFEGKAPAHGGHGTDMFQVHPELPGFIVHWFVTTLLKTPGHAPADTLAAAPVLNQLQTPGGTTQITQQLLDARDKDPQAQLWPEVAVDIIGEDYQRAGDVKNAIEVFKLNLLAYPDSADAHNNLADAYLADGQKDLARKYAEKALTMIDSHKAPLSSWSDTEQRRREIRSSAERVLKSAGAAGSTSSVRAPGSTFRDCGECPEMVLIPAGTFTMGSSDAEKSWAATHGASAKSVADEAPQRTVSLKSFALGKYDITRGEYAAFVRETGHPVGDGCGRDSFKWNKQKDLSWQNPGFSQSDRDPVVCVSWRDAHDYVDWLNSKVRGQGVNTSDAPYRLPTEAEWEYAARAGGANMFWWGDVESAAGDHAWYKVNSDGHTHPVGMKPANGFGLYDIVGNVWQWTEDCYAESYANAPNHGGANETGATCMRVDRGGSWMYPAWLLRSATRERNPADYRDAIMGFRIAKSLP